ncbi:DUF3667 domain-containing protein [Massilia sp. YMA4]|uniref:DUF3667 domain-containing protein n=1 Tax=Massilia sp. YMA4 TaxID=1593482 RepID=UPI001D0CC26B|nr:DUF3667 domain-containing protein [Massilia sp. YMA4]
MKPATIEAAGHHEVPANCRNCGAAVSGHYCAQCGQETRLHVPSLAEFVHEFIGHYVAVEGRLWGTLVRLLFRPGALTAEYLAGRRRRYVEPLRLYLSMSILFFALMKLSGAELARFDSKPDGDKPAVGQQHAGKRDGPVIGGAEKLPDDMPHHTTLPAPLERLAPGFRQSLDNFDRMSVEQKSEILRTGFYRYAPYVMFCLMPLFALYLKLLYLGSGRRYGEHVLFALHTNAFAFAVLAAFIYLPESFLKFVMFCWLVLYLPWAMKRVYGKSRWGTAWRWLLLFGLHGLSLALGVVAALALGVAFAH